MDSMSKLFVGSSKKSTCDPREREAKETGGFATAFNGGRGGGTGVKCFVAKYFRSNGKHTKRASTEGAAYRCLGFQFCFLGCKHVTTAADINGNTNSTTTSNAAARATATAGTRKITQSKIVP